MKRYIEWARDLFGWFKPSEEERKPLPDGTLPYRLRGGPLSGEILYLHGNETLTFRLRNWHGKYVRKTPNTMGWVDEEV